MNAEELSIADSAGSRLKLIELRVMLTGNLTLRSLPVKIRARAIIQRGVNIDPYVNIRIAGVGGGRWRIR